MPGAEPNDELPIVESSVPCRHLRNKGMYVYTDGLGGNEHADYDNTIYWCLKSMKGFGPDDEMVGGEDCRDASRTCYEPF
ncbi:hypothetical protein ACYOEI_39760 [Singulisphaera rosea]